ncbi:MAG: galactokinase family protein, partial [Verrucomicrobiota bacterium]
MQIISSFAPGRVELLGNHTDYNGGVVLSAAIDRGVTAQGTRRDDGQIVLTSEGVAGVVTACADKLAAKDSWADYPLGVAKVFQEAGHPISGFEV